MKKGAEAVKRTNTTVVIAVVVALLLAAGGYGALAHQRTVVRNGTQAPTPAANAVATAQPNADSQVQPAPAAGSATPTSPAAATAKADTPPTTASTVRLTPVSRGNDRKPLAGRVVFLDAGHGIPGSGANGPNGGDEAANNLATALLVRDKLQSAGARVVMTRTKMINPTVPGRTNDQLEARTIMANDSNADIFVSLHENLSEEYPGARGLTVYYRSGAASLRLAQKIDAATIASTGWYNFGIDIGNYYVLNNSTLKAAVLVECGFLSNATDERLLGTAAFRSKVATGIFNGIVAYFQ